MIIFKILLTIIVIKILWIFIMTYRQGTFQGEEKEILQRAEYLVSKISDSPEKLMKIMPKWIPTQFQGEWAIYSCSMTCKALSNIVLLYPKYKDTMKQRIEKIIDIVLSKEVRKYDADRWNEDPLKGIEGNLSHLSYYSILAWMIGEYKSIYGNSKYDKLYHSLCEALNRRILNSPSMNIPTYPYESIYIPDMLVAIVALAQYSSLNNGKYKNTVDTWISRAKTEWIDGKTGLLRSRLESNDISGAYSALNCYYLSLIDVDFGREQYIHLKQNFKHPFIGLKEHVNSELLYEFDIDAGPLIYNISPSGTAFAIGSATIFNDKKFRKQILKVAEIVATTVTRKGKTHYLLSNIALVGEAIMLAMRTTVHSYSK